MSLPEIPVYPSSTCARQRIIDLIARAPSEFVFRDKKYKCRLASPSLEKKAHLAGFMNSVNAMEVMVALDEPFDFTALNRETALVDSKEYSFVSAQQLDGENCYNITLDALV